MQNVSYLLVIPALLLMLSGQGDFRSGSESLSSFDRTEALRSSQSIFIVSYTSFASSVVLQKDLGKKREFKEWGLVFVNSPEKADIVITIQRPLKYGFDYTFNMVHRRSGIVLGSGKTIAIDGLRASPELADDIVKFIKEARPASKKK